MLDAEHCLIALKAFPLAEQLGKPVDEDEIAKVQGFYAKHGFQPAGGDFMVKDARLCVAMKRRLRRHSHSSHNVYYVKSHTSQNYGPRTLWSYST